MSNAAKKLESFTQFSFRQTRFSDPKFRFKLKLLEKEFEVLNWSKTGLAFSSVEEFKENQIFSDAKVFERTGHNLYTGAIEVRSMRKSEEGSFVYGVKFLSGLLNLELIPYLSLLNEIPERTLEIKKITSEVSQEVSHFLIRVGAYLNNIKSICHEIESRLKKEDFYTRSQVEQDVFSSLSKEVTKELRKHNENLSNLVDVENMKEGSSYHLLFEQMIYPYFQDADIVKRAKEKPLGYAGDFEMMNQIYRSSYEGKNLFGKILHKYVTDEASSNSVKYRRPYFKKHIKETLKNQPNGCEVLTVACGPCIEFQDLIEELPEDQLQKINMNLFDLDHRALEHAQTKILEKSFVQNKEVNAKFINASVREFLSHESEGQGSFDLIYSGGLFDYLDNRTSAAITGKLFHFLKPGGRLIIGNFTNKNTTKAFCHLVTYWHLIHKSEIEIAAWSRSLNKSEFTQRIDFCDERINAFLVLEKK